ncbi:MAG: pitrilysin family protein [Candidatus Babeliales bacterium]
MAHSFRPLEIHRHTLKNGLTLLVRQNNRVPRVDIQMWYGVGSKDETDGQRGMAHLLEHMLFKGTKLLSETDINIITHKLGGESNAFTTHDYTCYTYRLPSVAWFQALPLLADCMVNARLDEQMLASELRTVVEELRMYRDDYQNCLIEHMMETVFVQHPYHHPIIGTKQDLCGLTGKHLHDFYKQHYHPGNAMLLVAGDVDIEDVINRVEKEFGHIESVKDYKRSSFPMVGDLVQKAVTLYRPTKTPWSVYAYTIPGFSTGQNHIFDIAALILANGRSSRLYQRLVNEKRLAFDVECSVYDFHEQGFFVITLYPVSPKALDQIEVIIKEEIALLASQPLKKWEFQSAKKRTMMDYATLLESNEKQAMLIGSSFMATGNEQFINAYFEKSEKVSPKEIQTFFATYCSPLRMHKGYLLPLMKGDLAQFKFLQDEDNALEQSVLTRAVRSTPVEEGKFVTKIEVPKEKAFSYPRPEQKMLDNGLELMWYHNGHVPQITIILNFKAFAGYDPEGKEGVLAFLLRTMTDATKKHTSYALSKILELEGISLIPFTDGIGVKCLSSDLDKALGLLKELLLMPSFAKESIEKVRGFILNELDEYWDTPIDFIDQIAKDIMYKGHPYSKYPWGTKKSITALTAKDLKECYKKFVSPQGAQMIVVGDFKGIDIPERITKTFKQWQGEEVGELQYPAITQPRVKTITRKMNRDQVALAFVAPSISRLDEHFYQAAILDTVVTGGGQAVASSRLFALREKTGLFYGIGGSLLHQAKEKQGLVLIKTIVSPDKVEKARKLILQTLEDVKKNGITQDEFDMARRHLISSSVELFENNMQTALTFLFLKKYKLNFNLFDKLSSRLSIMKLDEIQVIAKQLCSTDKMITIRVGK